MQYAIHAACLPEGRSDALLGGGTCAFSVECSAGDWDHPLPTD
eukprot:CAMPEP_0206143762 /NCGR_PEP_ID=MMETSP1473-20131121/21735_1 /ASSEMBLY_ACC=CAM_ASM_001109 /TAXON_ID=1461547 /ORGANISM="Stichococcus sp, Strain RCC1054" /LENGTH=42 /DNA_ID= /DNA_START= /DNA_END= /DNA_ORIENTATION=